jgi:integrase
LNATRVRGLKSAGLFEDGGGLRLVVSDGGAKRWVMRISVRGKRHQLGLGSFPVVSLEQAREKAADIRKAASEGRNILADRRARKQGAVTFRQAFETFFASKGPTLTNAKHCAQWRSTMESYVFPIIGDRPVADVLPDEVLAIMRPLWRTKPETAGRVLQRIDAVLQFAIANSWRERASACIGARQVLGSRRDGERNHHRFLPYRELPAFIAQLRDGKCTTTKLALEWLILTAARSGETRLARWSEINERSAVWEVPKLRMKARRTHRVPLSSRCIEILQEARAMHPGTGLIFPSANPEKPLSDMTLTKFLRDMGVADRATVHGMRSAFKVWCAKEAKVPDEISEAALAHAIPQKVRAAYLRTDFFRERRRLMARWAAFVLKPLRAASPERGGRRGGESQLREPRARRVPVAVVGQI